MLWYDCRVKMQIKGLWGSVVVWILFLCLKQLTIKEDCWHYRQGITCNGWYSWFLSDEARECSQGSLSISSSPNYWSYGPKDFLNYMNSLYIPIHTGLIPIVYGKMGTTGLAGQMKGVCDCLLLALVQNKSIQSRLLVLVLMLVIAPAISPRFFDTTLSTIRFVSNLTPLVELYHIQQRIPCVDWKCDWQKEFGNATVLIRSRNIFAHKLQKLYSLDGIGLKGIRDWYDVCIPNLFIPSTYLNKLVSHYESVFEHHHVIGVHVRMAGSAVKWKDRKGYLSLKDVDSMIHFVQWRLKRTNLVFLATDTEIVVNRFQNVFSNQILVVEGYSIEHVGMNQTEIGLEKTSLDLLLLSRCDELVLTRQSHFSLLAKHFSKRNVPVHFFPSFVCYFLKTTHSLFESNYVMITVVLNNCILMKRKRYTSHEIFRSRKYFSYDFGVYKETYYLLI